MNVKVGDKVRIKTEEELLASDGSWHIVENLFKELFYARLDYSTGSQRRYTIAVNKLGKIYTVSATCQDGKICVNPNNTTIPIDVIAEILPRQKTLDEYICSLPLEERAEKFVYKYKEFVYAGFDSYYTKVFASSLTQNSYNTYDEALQATIEALKQPKEM